MNSLRGCFFLRSSRFLLFSLAVIVSLGIFSCGGGGGGSSSGGTINTPAEVSSSNAVALTATAYTAMEAVPTFDSFGGSAMASGSNLVGMKELCRLTQKVVARVENYEPSAGRPAFDQSSVAWNSGAQPGTYGGTMSISLNINENTGAFTGAMSFNNFSEEQGVTENGTIRFAGVIDIDALASNPDNFSITSMSMNFSAYRTVSENETFTLSGTATLAYTGDDYVLEMDLTATENGETVKFTDFTISCTDYGTYLTMHVTGRFGSAEYGYVDMTTETDLTIGYSDDYPSAGAIIATGDTGALDGVTKARIEFLSSSTYQVTADTDGDNTYDWDSGVLGWEDI
jgi:hypothetical protein